MRTKDKKKGFTLGENSAKVEPDKSAPVYGEEGKGPKVAVKEPPQVSEGEANPGSGGQFVAIGGGKRVLASTVK